MLFFILILVNLIPDPYNFLYSEADAPHFEKFATQRTIFTNMLHAVIHVRII